MPKPGIGRRKLSYASSRLSSTCTSCFVLHVIIYRCCPLFTVPPSPVRIFHTPSEGPPHTVTSSTSSLPLPSTQPTMEAQVLYFTCRYESQWSYHALPISMTHLDSIPPSVPKSIHRVHDFGNWSHLGKLIDELNKLLAANGALNGWYVHDRILLVAFLEI